MVQVCAEGKGRSVLVVDSEPEIVELLECMLRALGYSVVSALSRFEATRLLQSVPVDVVIAGEHVFESEEREVAARFRGPVGSIPILLLSAGADRNSSPVGILPKPFHFTELREKVAAAISRSREAIA